MCFGGKFSAAATKNYLSPKQIMLYILIINRSVDIEAAILIVCWCIRINLKSFLLQKNPFFFLLVWRGGRDGESAESHSLSLVILCSFCAISKALTGAFYLQIVCERCMNEKRWICHLLRLIIFHATL